MKITGNKPQVEIGAGSNEPNDEFLPGAKNASSAEILGATGAKQRENQVTGLNDTYGLEGLGLEEFRWQQGQLKRIAQGIGIGKTGLGGRPLGLLLHGTQRHGSGLHPEKNQVDKKCQNPPRK